MKELVTKHMLEIFTIRIKFICCAVLTSQLFSANLSIVDNSIFIADEGSINFSFDLELSESDTLKTDSVYSIEALTSSVITIVSASAVDFSGSVQVEGGTILFSMDAELSGSGITRSLNVQASTVGPGGSETNFEISGPQIVTGTTAQALELHEVGIEIGVTNLIAGQGNFDDVLIRIHDLSGIGIFTTGRSFEISLADGGVDLELAVTTAPTGMTRNDFTYTLGQDFSGSSIELSSGSPGSSFRVRPASNEPHVSTAWQISTNELTLSSTNNLSIGTPVLSINSDSVLICNDENIPLSFTLGSSIGFPALESEDEITLHLPDGSWFWENGSQDISFTMGIDSELPITANILHGEDTHLRNQEIIMVVNDDGGNGLLTDVSLRSGHLAFTASPERLVEGQRVFDDVVMTLTDVDEVGLFTESRNFILDASDQNVSLEYTSIDPGDDVSFDEATGTISFGSDLSSTFILEVSTIANSRIQVRPSLIQTGANTQWELQVSNDLTLEIDSTISIGTPSLLNTGDSVLICGDTDVDLNFTIGSGETFQALDTDDEVELLLPSPWLWGSNNSQSLSLVMGSAGTIDVSDSIVSVGDVHLENQALVLRVNGDLANSIGTGVNLKSGHLGFNISEERLIVGQTLYDDVALSLVDEDTVGIFTKHRSFYIESYDLGIDLDFNSTSSPIVDSVSFDDATGELTIDGDLRATTTLLISDGSSIQVRPALDQQDTTTSWGLRISNTTLLEGSTLSMGTPSISITNNSVLLCKNPHEEITLHIDFGSPHLAIDSADKIRLKLPGESNWSWSGGDGSGIILLDDLSQVDTILIINASLNTTSNDSINIQFKVDEVMDQWVNSDAFLSSGNIGINISDDERLIIGQESEPIRVIFNDLDEVGIFEGDESFFLTMPSFSSLNWVENIDELSVAGDTLKFLNESGHAGDFSFDLFIFGGTSQLLPTGLDFGFYSQGLSVQVDTTSSIIQIGNMNISHNYGNRVFIKGNPGEEVIALSISQIGQVQNLLPNDTLLLRISDELDMQWASWNESDLKPVFLETPMLTANSKVLKFPVNNNSAATNSIPIETRVTNFIDTNISGESIYLSCREGSWHDETEPEYKIDAISIHLNESKRIWSRQTLSESIAISISSGIGLDTLNNPDRKFYVSLEGEFPSAMLSIVGDTLASQIIDIGEKRYVAFDSLSGMGATIENLIFINPIPDSILSKRRVELFAFDPSLFPENNPNSLSPVNTIQMGIPIFESDSTTHNIFVINSIPNDTTVEWNIFQSPQSQAINDIDDIQIKIPSRFASISSAVISFGSNSEQLLGLHDDGLLTFDVTPPILDSLDNMNLLVTFDGVNNLLDQLDTLSISLDGGNTWVNDVTPRLFIDAMTLIFGDDTTNFNYFARFPLGSTVTSAFPPFSLSGVDVLTENDSIRFSFDFLKWGTSGRSEMAFPGSSTILVDEDVYLNENATEPNYGTLSLSSDLSGDFLWTFDSLITIGQPMVALSNTIGRTNFPLDDSEHDAFNHGWELPQIILSEDEQYKAWRSESVIRLSRRNLPFNFMDSSLSITALPGSSALNFVVYDDVIEILLGSNAPPDQIRIDSLFANEFSQNILEEGLSASYDGYSDASADYFSYSDSTIGKFSIGDPSIAFKWHGNSLDQVLIPNGIFSLDTCWFTEQDRFAQAFQDGDTLMLTGIDTIWTTPWVSELDFSAFPNLIIETDSVTEHVPQLWLNRKPIRSSGQKLVVAELSIYSESQDMISGNHVYISQDTDISVSANKARYPNLSIVQGDQRGISRDNPTLYLKLPENTPVKWAKIQSVTDWSISVTDPDSLRMELTSNPDTDLSDTIITIDSLLLDVGKGSSTPQHLMYSILPPRRTEGTQFYQSADLTGPIVILDPTITIQYEEGAIVERSLFIVGDPICRELFAVIDQTYPEFKLSNNDTIFVVNIPNGGVAIEPINYDSDNHDNPLPMVISVGSMLDISNISFDIPTTYQGSNHLAIPWEYLVGKPIIQSRESELITASKVGDYHWLNSIDIIGDDIGTMGPNARDTLIISLPNEGSFRFPSYHGGLQSSQPEFINPVWLVNNTLTELKLPIRDSLAADQVISLSSIPINMVEPIGIGSEFSLDFGLHHSRYNPIINDTIAGSYKDLFSKMAGQIEVSIISNGSSTKQLTHIRNSTSKLMLEDLRITWSPGFESTKQIDSFLLTLPQSSGVIFYEDSSRVKTISAVGAEDSLILIGVIDSIGTINQSESFPVRGEFPISMRVVFEDNSSLLVDGLNLRVAAPRFYIPVSEEDSLFHVRLAGSTIPIDSLIILDDPEYPVIRAGSISEIRLDWQDAIGWEGSPNGIGIDSIDINDPNLWQIHINPASVDSFIITGIDLLAESSLRGRKRNPTLIIRDSKVELENSFFIGNPSLQPIDTVLDVAFDELAHFPGILFVEDSLVSMSAKLNHRTIRYQILTPGIKWAENNSQILVSHLLKKNEGDMHVLLQNQLIDQRELMMSLEETLSVAMSLPEIDGDLGTFEFRLDYPVFPAQPNFQRDRLFIPLFAGETIAELFILSTRGDTIPIIIDDNAYETHPAPMQLPDYPPNMTVTFPSAYRVSFSGGILRNISQKLSAGDSLNIKGLINTSTTRGLRGFSVPINIYPFQNNHTGSQSHVYKAWPDSTILINLTTQDTVSWHLFSGTDNQLDTIASGVSESLLIPNISEPVNGMIYYLQYSPIDTIYPGFKLVYPFIIDNTQPEITGRWPIPGDSSPDEGIQAHPISKHEVMATFYFENLLPLINTNTSFEYWDSLGASEPDTLILLEGFENTGWGLPVLHRRYLWSTENDERDSSIQYLWINSDGQKEYSTELNVGNLFSSDSIANILGAFDFTPQTLTVTTSVTDMAGNQSADSIVYPLVGGDDSPVYDHLFNYPNPFNPRKNEETKISFLLREPTESVSFIVLDGAGSMVKQFDNEDMEAGRHEILWDGINLWGETCASGVYFGVLDVKDLPQVYVKILIVNR